MCKFFISSIIVLVISFNSYSQKKTTQESVKDSITYKTGYGLRIGADISRPVLSLFDKSYSGLELVGDYRITKNWYLATELGYEKETTFEDFTTSTSQGSFIRIGANYNAYKNWLDMNNEIFIGGRYGFALFDHSLDSYTPNTTLGTSSLPGSDNTTAYFPSNTITTPQKETGLMAHWAEIQIGMKVETMKNLFIGAGFSYKILISIDDQTGFKSLYSPGFNRIFESNTGFGFFYTISYLIPFVNK
ncbi:hypothetical protein SAMN04489761_0290 [Tenacibaculum sp. MAR_2009_124]|uniref:DUF6048 family protein n=1 Tax=Tenacibaculum sp. MAR_2009_124 TaxID=1250059 RepID=UPI000897E296|nr:DUF6048 family protein [Tenacibaculum sp. MAR_2009_124]SEB37894.1 hypothetical protein SAMN04489761_0290 [Tenacibaculum sp. MAR_2009_124]